jgi:hypothetical protein
MAVRKALGHWIGAAGEVVLEDGLKRKGRLVGVEVAGGEMAENDSNHGVEHPGVLQVSEHAIHAIRGLLDLFQDENSIIEVRREAGPNQPREHRQVSPE